MNENTQRAMSAAKHTPGPWYYVTGAVWTKPNGPDDVDGQCIAARASLAHIEPSEKDRNMQLIAQAPAMAAILARILAASESGNIGLINGEAVLCKAFEMEARQVLEAAGARLMFQPS